MASIQNLEREINGHNPTPARTLARAGETGQRGEATAWAARAGELSLWADRLLVNRRDAWGTYTPPGRRGSGYTRRDGTAATVPDSYTAKGALAPDLIARHFRGRRAEHVIGLHTTCADNLSRWGALDIDQHGDLSPDPAVNQAAALAWYDRLRGLGFTPLLTDSNGRGGYHLRVVICEAVPTARVYGLMRWLVKDYADHGLGAPPETFPKQPQIEPGRFGNWLRLPGRHHTREHWSRVWDGSDWLAGVEAVNFLLATVAGDPPTLIPAGSADYEPPKVRVTVRFVSAHQPRRARPVDVRVRAYMARLPHLSEGQGRDNIAYGFACWLVRDLGLGDDQALDWLERWDQGNRPPKGTQRLREIMASARRYGRHPVACGVGGQAR
jgi:hypothetical protein